MIASSRPRRPVLLLVRELGIGGIERDVAKLATTLDPEIFEPHVGCFYARGLRYDDLRDAGVPIVELPVRSFRSPGLLSAAAEFRNYIRRHRIQLVHSYDGPTTHFTVPLARLLGVPAIVSSQLGYRYMFGSSHRRILRFTDHLVNRIHVNCEAMRRHLIEDERVPPERIYLCYNGVDTKMFFPRQQPRPDVVAGAEIVIGTVCALRSEKRVDLLIEAFASVRRLRPQMKLLIVGSGPLLESLEAKAAALGVQADCVFVPATSDVTAWMRAIDIFVIPSDSEAFSNALLEAMACGCCPIGSRVGGTPEQIDDGRNGLLFDVGNLDGLVRKLTAVISDASLRLSMGSAAAVSARERFSLDRAARTMGALYESLLEPAAAMKQGAV